MIRKRIISIAGAAGIVILLGLMLLIIWEWNSPQHELPKCAKNLRITVPAGSSVTEYKDNHGCFGDGEANAEITLPKDTDKERIGMTGQNGWQPLPLPKDLSTLIFGNEYDSGCGNGQIRKTKSIQRGVYFFQDRNEEDLRKKISPLQNRYSQNFTFAIYAPDTHTLYYYTYDS